MSVETEEDGGFMFFLNELHILKEINEKIFKEKCCI